jgi:hydroxyethylthiazole kinase-like sugar kinase family protein
MAVRNPLYFSGGNLIAMSTGEIEEYRQKAQFVYSQNPTAVLTQVSSSGALIGAMADTVLHHRMHLHLLQKALLLNQQRSQFLMIK